MDVIIIYQIAILFLMMIAIFFAGAESLLVSSRKVSIEAFARKKHAGASRALYLLNNLEDVLSSILIGNNIATIAATAFITYVATTAYMFDDTELFILTAVQTVCFLLVCELLPKLAARSKAEKMLMFFSLPIKIALIIFKPVNFVCILFSTGVKKLLHIEDNRNSLIRSRDELDMIFQIGEKDGVIDVEHHMYVSGILSFKNLTAYELMTPTVDIISVELKSSIKSLVRVIESTRYSRIPVFDKRVDNIVGFVFYRDILNNKKAKDIQEIMQPAVYVPATKSIFQLFIEMRENKYPIVFVINERGGVIGMVSHEDIAEEIVGEIQTMDHGEDDLIVKVSDREYVLNGELDIDHFRRVFSIDIQKKGFETIAGFIMYVLGRIPAKGENFPYGKYSFTIAELSERSITKVIFKSKSKIKIAIN